MSSSRKVSVTASRLSLWVLSRTNILGILFIILLALTSDCACLRDNHAILGLLVDRVEVLRDVLSWTEPGMLTLWNGRWELRSYAGLTVPITFQVLVGLSIHTTTRCMSPQVTHITLHSSLVWFNTDCAGIFPSAGWPRIELYITR